MENLPSFFFQDCNQSREAGNHWWAEASLIISALHSSKKALDCSPMILMAQEVYDFSSFGSVSWELQKNVDEKKAVTVTNKFLKDYQKVSSHSD